MTSKSLKYRTIFTIPIHLLKEQKQLSKKKKSIALKTFTLYFSVCICMRWNFLCFTWNFNEINVSPPIKWFKLNWKKDNKESIVIKYQTKQKITIATKVLLCVKFMPINLIFILQSDWILCRAKLLLKYQKCMYAQLFFFSFLLNSRCIRALHGKKNSIRNRFMDKQFRPN